MVSNCLSWLWVWHCSRLLVGTSIKLPVPTFSLPVFVLLCSLFFCWSYLVISGFCWNFHSLPLCLSHFLFICDSHGLWYILDAFWKLFLYVYAYCQCHSTPCAPIILLDTTPATVKTLQVILAELTGFTEHVQQLWPHPFINKYLLSCSLPLSWFELKLKSEAKRISEMRVDLV